MTRNTVWLLLAVSLVGCSGQDRDTADALHRGNGPEPGTLDPHRQFDESAGRVVADLFEGLVLNGPDGRVLPGIARAWDVQDAGLSWRFELRDDARWCNGDRVTAPQFVAGLQRAVDPATAASHASLLEPIKGAAAIIAGTQPVQDLGVVAIDVSTLQITLERPTPALLDILALPIASPVHPSVEGSDETAFREPIGNGAYCFTEQIPQSHIRLDRNSYHPELAFHDISTVYYHTIEDLDAEFNRYRTGEIQVTVSVPPTRIAWIQAHHGDDLKVTPILASAFFGFNLAQPPFKENPDLRRALSLALDRRRLADVVFDGLVMPAPALVPPMADYQHSAGDWLPENSEARIAAARDAYARAGFDASNPAKFVLHYPSGGPSHAVARVTAAMWREVLGLQVELNQMEWRVYLAMLGTGATPGMYRYSWGADYADPAYFLRLFESGSHANVFGFASGLFDDLLAQAAEEPSREVRTALLSRAEGILISDSAFIPLYYDTSRRLVSPRVAGWQPNALDFHPTRFLSLQPR